MARYRIEKDALGSVNVPANAYYGSQTQRALVNFSASGLSINHRFIESYAMLKKAAALANMKVGKLDRRRCNAICKACDEIISGKFKDQFTIDAFQAGAGTSVNMNLNEVIANRAIEHLGGKKGDYKIVHPNDHVNMSQSTNDTFHTNVHLATYLYVTNCLMPSLKKLEQSLYSKSRKFSKIVKIGRTHLQEAVPITLGEEFSGYAAAIAKTRASMQNAASAMLDIPFGGTAVGTMINASEEYSRTAITQLNKITKCNFKRSKNRFASQQNQISELILADSIKENAVLINKIANDFRLLTSGPRAAIREILLPEVQPGSSIMPGKVNPSMPEMMNMICMQVIGLNAAITEGANSGQLELNTFMPMIAFNLMFSIQLMTNGINIFTARCVDGITADMYQIKKHLEENLSLATALNPYIGYSKAAQIAKVAYAKNKTIKQVCLEMKVLDKKTLDKILDPKNLV